MVAQITVLIFWTIFFGTLAVGSVCFNGDAVMNGRLRRFFAPPERSPAKDLLLSSEKSPKMKQLKRSLLLAGLHRQSDLDRVLFFKRVCLIIPVAIASTLFFAGLPVRHVLVLAVLLTLAFLLLPRFFILRSIFRRRDEIERQLPNTLDLLILCLEAGLSFDSALLRVAEEQKRVSSQISREFLFANHEILAGIPREQALKNLAWRCGVPDMQSLVGAILQSIKLGTSLVKTLRIQADGIRKKRRERVRAQILKTPVKLIFPLLFFIFPTLLIVILGPSLINIFKHLNNVGGGYHGSHGYDPGKNGGDSRPGRPTFSAKSERADRGPETADRGGSASAPVPGRAYVRDEV